MAWGGGAAVRSGVEIVEYGEWCFQSMNGRARRRDLRRGGKGGLGVDLQSGRGWETRRKTAYKEGRVGIGADGSTDWIARAEVQCAKDAADGYGTEACAAK